MILDLIYDTPTSIQVLYDRKSGVLQVPGYKTIVVHSYSDAWSNGEVRSDLMKTLNRLFPRLLNIRIEKEG